MRATADWLVCWGFWARFWWAYDQHRKLLPQATKWECLVHAWEVTT